MYRKTNVNEIDNNGIPLMDRLCTYEGSEYLAMQESIMSPILQNDLESICANIRRHVEEISSGNISI